MTLSEDQLRDRLRDLGIDQTKRALTDWRHKGLLPPLRQISHGRAGSEWFWNDDEGVVEQAIAAHCLMKKRARTDEAALGLWFSGYRIHAEHAQRAWLNHLTTQRNEVEKAASRLRERYLGVGRHMWRVLGRPQWLREFVSGLAEAAFDDEERDDEAYRASMAVLLSEVEAGVSGAEVHDFLCKMISEDWIAKDRGSKSKSDRSREAAIVFETAAANCLALIESAIGSLFDQEPGHDLFRFVDSAWDKIHLTTILINRESIQHVQSMRMLELEAANQSLAKIRKMVGRCVELTTKLPDERLSIQVQLAFMSVIGPYLAHQLISFSRSHPEWPLTATISAIHGFVMGVNSGDVSRGNNNSFQTAERVRGEWTTTRRTLWQLWSSVMEKSEA